MTLFCEICNVKIPSEAVMTSHLQGKRHRRLFEEQRKRKEEVECSIFVRGFPPRTTAPQLHRFFSGFGAVTNVFLESERDQFAFVRFQSPETVSFLLSPHFQPLYIGNSRLSIRPRQHRPVASSTKRQASPATSSSDTSKANRGDLVQQLGTCTDVEQQMVALQKTIELSVQEHHQREHIQQQLQELFQTKMSDCQVFLFGSSVSGVGMHGCDMDIFLDISSDDVVQQNAQSDDKFSPVLNSVSKMLRRCNAFNNILVIRSARCPLVKFDHVQSGLKCDLSMNNRLALQNTRLIKLLCDVDPRIQTLMYNVRYWAKLKQLAGNPSGGLRVTNYALTMMVIFYLQQLDTPMLPSIEQLAKHAVVAGQTCTIEGWDCSFGSDLDKLRSIAASNTDSLPHLLAGFFSFYATFDLSSYVLCPRTGTAVDIAAFSSCMKEDERLAQFKISLVCVQDPFVLNHNVTSGANERLRARFTAEAQAASGPFSQPDFSTPEPTRPWGIAGLLSAGPMADDVVPAAPPARQSGMHSFTIAMESSKLPVAYVQRFANVAELKDGWSRDLCALIRKLLEDVLFIKCEEIKETSQASASNESSEKKCLVDTQGCVKCNDSTSTTTSPSGKKAEQTTTTPSGKEAEQTTTRPSGKELEQATTRPSGKEAEHTTTRPSGKEAEQATTRPSGKEAEQMTTRPSGKEAKQTTIRPSGKEAEQTTTRPSGKEAEQTTGQGVMESEQTTTRPNGKESEQTTTRPSEKEAEQTTTRSDDQWTGHQLAEGSSSVKETILGPSRSASGEIRKTSEDMDELCVTSGESDVDEVEMEVEEGPLGKRPSSDNLVETKFSKRCRPEDKSPCQPRTSTDQATSSDVAVTGCIAPVRSSSNSGATSAAGQSCVGTKQNAGNDSSQSATCSGTQCHAASSVDKTNATGEHPEATAAVSPPATAPLPVGGTRCGEDGTTGNGLTYCLQCSSRTGVWSGRKKYHKTLKRSSLTGVEAEIQISKMVAAKLGEHTAAMDFSFRLTFACVSSHGQTTLVVDTQPTSGAKMFSCFFLFFKSFVNKHAQLAFK